MPVGSVKGIKITGDGHAEIELSIDGDHSPLRRGTRAEIRQFSQSGLANRYVDLKLPPDTDDTIPDGGVIDTDNTVTQVDLDELYNTLDPETRKSLQGFFQALGGPVARQGARGQRRLPVPEPGAVHLEPALQRADQGHAGARALPRGQLADRHRPRRAPRRPRRPDRQPQHHDARARQPEGGARRVDRPSPAVHAPRQHDVREPALHARRGRPARRGLEAGGEAPTALPLRRLGPSPPTPSRRCATSASRSASRAARTT